MDEAGERIGHLIVLVGGVVSGKEKARTSEPLLK